MKSLVLISVFSAITTSFAAVSEAIVSAVGSVDKRLASAQPPAKSLGRFLNYMKDGVKGTTFKANPDFWAKGVDFTCESVWKTPAGPGNGWNVFGVTAISPRHVIFSQHCAPKEGITLTFVGNDGKVITRKLGPRRGVPGDIFVGILDEDLPSTITPATILPVDAARRLGDGRGLPVVTLNQREEAVVADMTGFPTDFAIGETSAVKPRNPQRATYYKPVVSGDSSNPRFLLFGNRAVLMCLMWHGEGGSGTYLPLIAPLLRRAMDALKPGYELKEFDFAGLGAAPDLPKPPFAPLAIGAKGKGKQTLGTLKPAGWLARRLASLRVKPAVTMRDQESASRGDMFWAARLESDAFAKGDPKALSEIAGGAVCLGPGGAPTFRFLVPGSGSFPATTNHPAITWTINSSWPFCGTASLRVKGAGNTLLLLRMPSACRRMLLIRSDRIIANTDRSGGWVGIVPSGTKDDRQDVYKIVLEPETSFTRAADGTVVYRRAGLRFAPEKALPAGFVPALAFTPVVRERIWNDDCFNPEKSPVEAVVFGSREGETAIFTPIIENSNQ